MHLARGERTVPLQCLPMHCIWGLEDGLQSTRGLEPFFFKGNKRLINTNARLPWKLLAQLSPLGSLPQECLPNCFLSLQPPQDDLRLCWAPWVLTCLSRQPAWGAVACYLWADGSTKVLLKLGFRGASPAFGGRSNR